VKGIVSVALTLNKEQNEVFVILPTHKEYGLFQTQKMAHKF